MPVIYTYVETNCGGPCELPADRRVRPCAALTWTTHQQAAMSMGADDSAAAILKALPG